MPVHYRDIADIFDHVADLLEIEGANRFRVRAYRNAANTLRDQSRSVADIVENEDDLYDLPDIGDDLAGKIAEIVKTGQLPLLEEISGAVPDAIVAATRIPGIGPKRAKALFAALDLGSIDDPREAAEDGNRIAGATEEEVYEQIGVPWIDPVLREMRGEIEAAEGDDLPDLVTIDDIRGDLHVHTTASDGKNTMREMVRAARDRGYDYLAITDHSKSQSIPGGLDETGIEAQVEEIDALNEEFDGFRLLKSCEVDILEDGSLDFSDGLLKKLDLVVASVHSNFDLPADRQTERIMRSMENPLVSIVGHPTGRLIGSRRPYEIDIERIVEAAKERGCCLQLNADPNRLDLSDVNCRMARDGGVKVAISTDAPSIGGLGNMRFGIDQARRGRLETANVLNSRNWRDVPGYYSETDR